MGKDGAIFCVVGSNSARWTRLTDASKDIFCKVGSPAVARVGDKPGQDREPSPDELPHPMHPPHDCRIIVVPVAFAPLSYVGRVLWLTIPGREEG